MAPPQVGSVRVEWTPSLKRADRLRIRDHTCGCTYPMFEFCTAGGLWFVRHHPIRNPATVLESAWMPARAAQVLWLQILSGQAQ
ncbi:hypothetical protein [Nonomuraea sp. KM88]|uniref:hypothetical protein n=1 Tax=Nonomuraea sp. KM88 TaxID=3457427 RepID=UPI003FCCAB68